MSVTDRCDKLDRKHAKPRGCGCCIDGDEAKVRSVLERKALQREWQAEVAQDMWFHG